jgi:hypothetical protein
MIENPSVCGFGFANKTHRCLTELATAVFVAMHESLPSKADARRREGCRRRQALARIGMLVQK